MFNPWLTKLLILLITIQICHSINYPLEDSLELENQEKVQPVKKHYRFPQPRERTSGFAADPYDGTYRSPRGFTSGYPTSRPDDLTMQILEKIRGLIELIKDLSKQPKVNFWAGFVFALLLLRVLLYMYTLIRPILCSIWRFEKKILFGFIELCREYGPQVWDFLKTLGLALWVITKACWRMLVQKVNGIQTTGYRRSFNMDKTDFVSNMEKNEQVQESQVPVPNTVFVYDRTGEEASIVQ